MYMRYMPYDPEVMTPSTWVGLPPVDHLTAHRISA